MPLVSVFLNEVKDPVLVQFDLLRDWRLFQSYGKLCCMSHELETLPKGWSMQQCAKCHMVFALPPIEDATGTKANGILLEEVQRHVDQNHRHEDFSQAAVRIVRQATDGN